MLYKNHYYMDDIKQLITKKVDLIPHANVKKMLKP